jgi:5-methylcytosine-specific restriction endonuclease McrA
VASGCGSRYFVTLVVGISGRRPSLNSQICDLHPMKTTLIFLTFILLEHGNAFAHPGRTDSSGCHKRSSTGVRHCHNSGVEAYQPKARSKRLPAKPKLSRVDELIAKRIYSYFRKANKLSLLACNIRESKGKAAAKTRKSVFEKYNGECVICASKESVGLDYRRSLMNGGSHQSKNLALLCGVCQKKKTKLDKDLWTQRRKRCKRR